MKITVVGVDAGHPPSRAARQAVAEADLLVGSPANLTLAGAPDGVERVELGPLAPALTRLARNDAERPVVVASGDPGFFGVLRALRDADHDCTVLPALSSVARAAAAAGVSWDDAVVVSAHGRELRPAVNACRAMPLVIALTGPGAGPVELARGLAGWPRELVVGERLGAPDERVVRRSAADLAAASPDEFTDPAVVVCLAPGQHSAQRRDNQPAAAPADGWARPEREYEHRASMITKAEVRALVVARLRPRLGRLVLDVGAGSGSVGIECNRLGAAVIAVDHDGAATGALVRNAAAHDARIRVVTGEAPQALAGLPEADAAFVGGGGLDALGGVVAGRVPTVVAAFAALDRAVAAYRLLTDAGYRVEGAQLSAARLAELPGDSLRLAAENPVLVLAAERS